MRRPLTIRAAVSLSAVLLVAHALLWRTRAPSPADLLLAGRPWTALQALLGAVRLPLEMVPILVGVLSGAIVIWVVYDLAGRVEGAEAPAALVAPGLLAVSPLLARCLIGAPEVALFTAVLALTLRRTFDEVGTTGALSLSILPWALIGAWCREGMILLVVVFVHRLLYTRRYRQGRRVVAFVAVWAALSLLGAAILLLVLGGWSGGPFAGGEGLGAAPAASGLAPGPSGGASRLAPAARLWGGVRGLALLPCLLLLAVSWKPRPAWFLSVLAALVIGAWLLLAAARREVAGPVLDATLVPILPLLYLVVGESMRAGHAALAATGFGGRRDLILVVGFVGAVALATAWPSVLLIIEPSAG